MRVALPPGVAGAQGGKVLNFATLSICKLIQFIKLILVLDSQQVLEFDR
jgi:hypothetical protein